MRPAGLGVGELEGAVEGEYDQNALNENLKNEQNILLKRKLKIE